MDPQQNQEFVSPSGYGSYQNTVPAESESSGLLQPHYEEIANNPSGSHRYQSTEFISSDTVNIPSYPPLSLADGENFSYHYPLFNHKHHLVISKSHITTEFEDLSNGKYSSKTMMLSGANRIDVESDSPFARPRVEFWAFFALLYVAFLVVTFILTWVAISPDRPVKTLTVASDFAMVCFFVGLLSLILVFFSKFPRFSPIPIPRLQAPKYIVSYALYGFSMALSFAIFVCGTNLHARMVENGRGQNYYSHFIVCHEDKYQPSHPYVFNSVCDSQVLPSVQAMMTLLPINILIAIAAQLMYFGHFLPFYFVNYTDKKANPVKITFRGADAAGFPSSVILPRKDTERVMQIFHENFDSKKSPQISISETNVSYFKRWGPFLFWR